MTGAHRGELRVPSPGTTTLKRLSGQRVSARPGPWRRGLRYSVARAATGVGGRPSARTDMVCPGVRPSVFDPCRARTSSSRDSSRPAAARSTRDRPGTLRAIRSNPRRIIVAARRARADANLRNGENIMAATRRPGRNHLFVPGPTNIPDRVMRAMMVQSEDHRSVDFPALTKPLFEDTKAVFGSTDGTIFLFPASGTGIWESALSNTLVARRQGAGRPLRPVQPPLDRHGPAPRPRRHRPGRGVGHGCEPERIGEALRADKDHEIKAVMVVHNETATGVTSDIGAVRKAIDAAGHPALLFVDGVSSIGSLPLQDGRVEGRLRHRRLAEGPDAPRRPRRRSASARRRSRPPRPRRARTIASPTSTSTGRITRSRTRPATSPTPRRCRCSTACAKPSPASTRKGSRTSTIAITCSPRRPARPWRPGA